MHICGKKHEYLAPSTRESGSCGAKAKNVSRASQTVYETSCERAKRLLYDHAVLSAKVRYPSPAVAKLMTSVRGSHAFCRSVVAEVQPDTGTHAAQQDEHG